MGDPDGSFVIVRWEISILECAYYLSISSTSFYFWNVGPQDRINNKKASMQQRLALCFLEGWKFPFRVLRCLQFYGTIGKTWATPPTTLFDWAKSFSLKEIRTRSWPLDETKLLGGWPKLCQLRHTSVFITYSSFVILYMGYRCLSNYTTVKTEELNVIGNCVALRFLLHTLSLQSQYMRTGACPNIRRSEQKNSTLLGISPQTLIRLRCGKVAFILLLCMIIVLASNVRIGTRSILYC